MGIYFGRLAKPDVPAFTDVGVGQCIILNATYHVAAATSYIDTPTALVVAKVPYGYAVRDAKIGVGGGGQADTGATFTMDLCITAATTYEGLVAGATSTLMAATIIVGTTAYFNASSGGQIIRATVKGNLISGASGAVFSHAATPSDTTTGARYSKFIYFSNEGCGTSGASTPYLAATPMILSAQILLQKVAD
jgi:hypothetical protein